MVSKLNSRQKPVAPGNGVRSISYRSVLVEKDPKRETLGLLIAKLFLIYASIVHLLIIPFAWLNDYNYLGRDSEGSLFLVCGWLIFGGLFLIPVGRAISNALTRDEECIGYNAVRVYFGGFVLYFCM
ncbi:MAG: hypothetical protein ABGY95_07890 [Rubritalea sp.]|uniref:hypothetical protein n=1 Tax=Rubritalea sp. TaxID=2109375 RepID=UPI0032423B5E